VLKNTVTAKKEVWTELKQLISRLPSFLATGAPKTLGDIQSYFVKYGDVKGAWELTKDIWMASHIGLPLSMAAVDTVYNLYYLDLPQSAVFQEKLYGMITLQI
jgi:hypothetical protein